MRERIAYGRDGLVVEIPDELETVVVRPSHPAPLADSRRALTEALRSPIDSPPLVEAAAALAPDARIGIVFNDITRATPNEAIITAIAGELAIAGIPDDRVTLFNATGTHRANTADELEAILGREIVRRFRIVQNDAEDEASHRLAGATSRGNRVYIHAEFLTCALRIATGFIEPHFFAGYSGGGKAVVPGLAGLQTVLFNHGASHMDDPGSTWGVTSGNPLWEDLDEAAGFADPVFLVDVTLDGEKRITGVFAGGRRAAHRAGCEAVARHAIVEVDGAFDVVVTSNSGYPLDLNLYQAVKGMSAAERIVRPDGLIVVAAECWDGIPSHGLFAKLISGGSSARELLARLREPDLSVRDAWQAHIFARIREHARIELVSHRLGAADLPAALISWSASVERSIADEQARLGRPPRVCVLPDGPLTIPRLR